jgi:hypothetical protein
MSISKMIFRFGLEMKRILRDIIIFLTFLIMCIMKYVIKRMIGLHFILVLSLIIAFCRYMQIGFDGMAHKFYDEVVNFRLSN